jgi:hypothetical protein
MVPEALRPLDEDADGDQREYAHHKLNPPVSFALRWCNVLEIEITAKELDGKNGSMEKIAFTLCALLQDSLFSIFPGTCDRVAVVSPQADLGKESEFSPCHLAALPLLMYPRYEENSGDTAKPDALTIYVIEDSEEDWEWSVPSRTTTAPSSRSSSIIFSGRPNRSKAHFTTVLGQSTFMRYLITPPSPHY